MVLASGFPATKSIAMDGWYYLHVNGDLIFKRETDGSVGADIRESDLARGLWPVYCKDRENAWSILVESLASGASKQRVSDLAEKWKCDDNDAATYADRVGCLLSKDGNAWCASRKDFVNIQESPVGFGETCLDAMAALCRDLGYKPSKMRGATFKHLLASNR
jgi:hypothetical protein